MALKKRHRLKKKVIRKLVQDIGKVFGVELDWTERDLDMAKSPKGNVYILNGEIVGLDVEGTSALSLRGILKHRPVKGFVTVDMGAVAYVTNGADVMAPGVVDADLSLEAGDVVYVRDQKNLQPLAVGKSLVSGKEMITMTSGPVVSTHHFIGDPLWEFGHDEE
jgi:PUA domain protein